MVDCLKCLYFEEEICLLGDGCNPIYYGEINYEQKGGVGND